MYAFRFFGLKFYGEQMVAETHILLQQFNMFSLVSISIVSGFQSRIVLAAKQELNKKWIWSTYRKIQTPTIYLAFLVLASILLFTKDLLGLIAPQYDYLVLELRITCVFIAFFLLFNPLFYLFFMNKRVAYRRRVTLALYIVLGFFISMGMFIETWQAGSFHYWGSSLFSP